jgi:hypothetical protein
MHQGPNVQSPPLRLGGGFGGVLDQLEDHDHQDDDDQDSDYGPHPWGHCCHLYPASLRPGGSWSLKFRGGSVISYP